MRSLYCLLFLLLCPIFSMAQYEQKNDSLVNILKRADQDTIKLNALNELFYLHFYEHPEKSLDYIQRATSLAEQVNDTKWMVETNNNLAYWYRVRGKFDKSIEYYTIALGLARKHHYNQEISEALQGIGNVYWRKADYQKARRYHEENLQFCKEINDQSGIASSYNNLGNIYNEEGNYTSALEHYINASKINSDIHNEHDLAINLGNIGLMQSQLKHFEKAIEYYNESRLIAEKYDKTVIITWLDRNIGLNYKYLKEYEKSIDYYLKALKAYEKHGEVFEVAEVYRLIGNLYLDMDSLEKAEGHYLKSLEINRQIPDSSGIAYNSSRLSDVYIQQENWNKALHYSLLAKQIGEALNNPRIIMNAEADLSVIYSAIDNYKAAHASLEHHLQIKDSLVGAERNTTAQEMEARFQNELKEQEIEKLNAENKVKALQLTKRENERNYILGISILILLLGTLTFRMYKVQSRTNEKLQELDKLKTRFFANISHEFRSPLTLILGMIEDKINHATKKKTKEEFTVIKRNAQRLSKLIDQLLDLSKIEAQSLKLSVLEKDISEHLRIIAASYTSLSAQKNISFSKTFPEEKSEVYYDPEKLDKIVYNLLSNAFKFTPEGGEISFNTVIKDGHLIITVKDNGTGIPKTHIDHVFDRFYQAENTKGLTQPGTGIGLSLVQELVELHHGKIEVQSEVNKGSSFTVTLPINKKAFAKEEFSELSDLSSESIIHVLGENGVEKDLNPEKETDNNKGVVLIAEDDVDMRNFIFSQLHKQYKVIQASNGSEGMEKALKLMPELIVTDVMMPESDGIAFCQNIKSNEITSHIPVIMLTAKADMDSKLEGLRTGADDYITKPFEGRELKVRIENLIKQRQQLRMKFSKSIFQHAFEVPHPSKDELFLKKALSIVEQHLDQSDFSSKDFQNEMGYSRMQLHRKLKTLTNHSTTEFIRTYRLNRASELLSKSDLTISETCYSVGFSNLSYFTRSFKAQFSVSPKEYLSKNRKVNTI